MSKHDYSKAAINARFVLAVDMYRSRVGAISLVKLAKEWGIHAPYLTNVMNGHKDLHIPMLLAGVRYAGFNANYILTGEGEVFNKMVGRKVKVGKGTADLLVQLSKHLTPPAKAKASKR